MRADGRDGDLASALLTEALQLTQETGDRPREAAIWSNIGDVRFDQGDADGAAAAVRRSIEILTEVGREGEEFIPEVWKLTEW